MNFGVLLKTPDEKEPESYRTSLPVSSCLPDSVFLFTFNHLFSADPPLSVFLTSPFSLPAPL